MAADATSLLAAISAELIAAFPNLEGPNGPPGCPPRVYISKRQVAGNKPPKSGWVAGYQAPAYVLSMVDEEIIDQYGDFEQISVTYPLLVEYVKQTQTAICAQPSGGAERDGPAISREDPEIRCIKQAIRQAIYKPSVTSQKGMDLTEKMVNVELRSRRTYDLDGTQTLFAVGMVFWFTLYEPRPDE